MRTVKIKVGQLWACPTFESWYQKHSLNSATELKYEGYRVTSIDPIGLVVGLQHVKSGAAYRTISRDEWTETEQQKLIEDVP